MSHEKSKLDFSKKSSGVILKNVTKIFQQPDGGKDFVAVDHINLEIKDGEMVTLLGPSGCGKTTTLRMISGFEYPTSGNVFFGDRDVAKIPPQQTGKLHGLPVLRPVPPPEYLSGKTLPTACA